MSKSTSNAQCRPPALGFGWKWGSIQMLGRVETPGCFLAAAAASGAGRAAQVRSDGQRLPRVGCPGPGSCLHRCLRSHPGLAQGIFLTEAGDQRSYRIAQPHSVCAASHPYRPPYSRSLSRSMQQVGLCRTVQKMRPSPKPRHSVPGHRPRRLHVNRIIFYHILQEGVMPSAARGQPVR